jgi:ADP-ribose pyrophosphatase
MTDERNNTSVSTLVEYLAFAKAHPALFVNPPEGGITILLDEYEIREVEAQMARWLESKGMPAEWARVGIAYQDQYARILRDAVRFPGGFLGTYIRFVGEEDDPPGVIVLPFYHGQVLLIRHFRHATRTWHIEIPRGFGKKGLSSEENARRELGEEIGATISRLVSLGPMYPDAAASTECDALYFAEVASYGKVEEEEAITEILPTSVVEFERMIRENEITDGFTLAAYARAKAKGLL